MQNLSSGLKWLNNIYVSFYKNWKYMYQQQQIYFWSLRYLMSNAYQYKYTILLISSENLTTLYNCAMVLWRLDRQKEAAMLWCKGRQLDIQGDSFQMAGLIKRKKAALKWVPFINSGQHYNISTLSIYKPHTILMVFLGVCLCRKETILL